MRFLFALSLILFICINCSCIKGPLHLDVFRIKANPGKFECYINGQDFVPDSNKLHLICDGPCGPIFTYVDSFDNGNYSLTIDANTPYNAAHKSQSIDLSAQNITGPGIYEFNTPEHQEADYILRSLPTSQGQQQPNLFYRQSLPGHGSLTITRFDAKNHVIAGTFWFNAVNSKDSTDVVQVTGGHFNINYANQ